ncbi:MAG: molecular chaperone TorD family protein [Myxococcota bacterium]|jgi:DMSO reductase family type II enzyme chaperone|nr:molecular chaperone TorD family protein [Myxococcota bacterium]
MSPFAREHTIEHPADLASGRSKLYQVFALALQYPNADWVDAIRQGELADAIATSLRSVDATLISEFDRAALTDAGTDDDALAVEYTRLFDVGPGGSPVSLFGGHHLGNRTQTMEEVLRFYLHFGLERDPTAHELPDHVISELEFLHFLTFQQARLEHQGEDSRHYLRGQRDFIERQLGRWIPKITALLREHEASPHYVELFRLLDLFVQHERETLSTRLDADPS